MPSDDIPAHSDPPTDVEPTRHDGDAPCSGDAPDGYIAGDPPAWWWTPADDDIYYTHP